MTKITLIEIVNPLDLSKNVRSEFSWEEGQTIGKLFSNAPEHVIVSLNGGIVERKDFDLTFVNSGDAVVTCHQVLGGDTTKSILRIGAFLALAYFTAGIAAGSAAGAFGSGTLAAGSFSAYAAAAAVGFAGRAFINGILPLEEASKAKSSTTYGVDGPSNTAEEGVAYPVVYGRIRTGGNIINEYVINDGDTQWYHVLINAGEGPIASITDIELNDQPITYYKNSTVEIVDDRLGTASQDVIQWFDDIVTMQTVNVELTNTWHVVTTDAICDRVRLDFVLPTGLSSNDRKGSHQSSVDIEAQFRPVDSTLESDWSPIIPTNPSANAPLVTPIKKYFQYVNVLQRDYKSNNSYAVVALPYTPNANLEVISGNYIFNHTFNQSKYPVGSVTYRQNYSNVYFRISENTTNAVRRSLVAPPFSSVIRKGLGTVPPNPSKLYDVRVRRTDATRALTNPEQNDRVYFQTLTQIQNDNVAYIHQALLGLRIKLDQHITGRPKITFVNGGRIIKVDQGKGYGNQSFGFNGGIVIYPGEEASSNPAWVALDMLTNTRFGGGQPISKFDMPAWRDWAKYCSDMGLNFHGAFDSQASMWDQVQKVMRCGHAKPVRVGTLRSVSIEREEMPSMMFSVANMIPGTFKESWLPVADRVNEIEATFLDAADNYKQKSIRAIDNEAAIAGKPQKPMTLDLFGVTNEQQAWNDMHLILNSNKYIIQTCEFSAPIEAIACKVGDVVLVQHDQPKWGEGGKLEAGSTSSTLILDRPVTFSGASQVKVHYHALQRYSGSITSAIHLSDSSIFTLSGFDRTKRVSRLIVAGKELGVLATFEGGVVCDPDATITSGSYTLWETDALEMRNVQSVSGVQVTLSSPLPSAPAQYANWLFGPVDKVGKPFRVKAISGSHDYERHITCVEYNATVFNPAGAAPTPSYSSLSNVIENSTIRGVGEKLIAENNRYRSVVTVSFDHSQPNLYGGSNVFASRDGAKMERIGFDLMSVSIDAIKGQSLRFYVQATNAIGEAVDMPNAPFIDYVVLGQTTPPGIVLNVTHEFDDYGLTVRWSAPTEVDWKSTDIRLGAWGDNVLLFGQAATVANIGFKTAGSIRLSLRHVLFGDLYSVTDTIHDVTILPPAAPVLGTPVILGKAVSLSWSTSKTSQPIDYYEIGIGGDTSTFLTTPTRVKISGSTLSTTLIDEEIGNRKVFIRAVDKGGNISAESVASYITSNFESAKILTLTADSQVFKVRKDGSHSPNSIALNAFMGGALTGTLSWSTTPTTLLSGSGATRSLDFNSMTSDSVKITAAVDSGGTLYSDTVTIFKISEGIDGTGVTSMLTNDTETLSSDADGTVVYLGSAVTTMKVYIGLVEDTANWVFAKVESSASIKATLVGSTLTVTSFDKSSSGEYIDLTAVKTGYPTQTRRFSVNKVSSAVNYDVQVESTNGDTFRVGQNKQTMLIAHVIKNGLEVTDSIPASRFRWRRVSYYPVAAPNDDATWNAMYATGYKQILVTVDAVSSRATFHCDILDQ